MRISLIKLPFLWAIDSLRLYSLMIAASFWSNSSPGKIFFTGNTTALETIGHTEEPREIEEDEFFNENLKASNEVPGIEGNEQQYYGEDGSFDYKAYDEYYGGTKPISHLPSG